MVPKRKNNSLKNLKYELTYFITAGTRKKATTTTHMQPPLGLPPGDLWSRSRTPQRQNQEHLDWEKE